MRAKKSKSPARWLHERDAPCPHCIDRDALSIVGAPRFNRGFKLTGGCEPCKGTGRIREVVRSGDKRADPWVLWEIKESAA